MRRFACVVFVAVFAAACQSEGRRVSEPPVWVDYVWVFVMGHGDYTRGYSDAALNAVEIGTSEAEVRRLLGEPLWEKWMYGSCDSDACDQLTFVDDRLDLRESFAQSFPPIRIEAGMSTAQVRAIHRPPTELDRMYVRSPGDRNFWKPAIVTMSNGTVTKIYGRLYYH